MQFDQLNLQGRLKFRKPGIIVFLNHSYSEMLETTEILRKFLTVKIQNS